MYAITPLSLPKFNILIYHTYQPEQLKTCIESILEQTYTNYEIIIGYKDERCEEYLHNYHDNNNITIHKLTLDREANHNNRYANNQYADNLYYNALLSKVNDGWIFFFDDVNKLAHDMVLNTIRHMARRDSKIIFWKVKMGNSIIYPKNIEDIEKFEISSGGLCFHSKYKNEADWKAKYCGEYDFISTLLLNITCKRKFIDEVLVETQQQIVEINDAELVTNQLLQKCMLKPVIVVSSTQYPGYGGAATNAYAIIKFLRSKDFNVVGVFFHNTLNVNYDPDNIGGIFLYLYKYEESKVVKDAFGYLKTNPTLCLAKNYRAPLFCKKIFKCYTVYLVSGINHFRLFYSNMSAISFLNPNFVNTHILRDEVETNTKCDSIVVNSHLTHKIFSKIYPEFMHKLREPVDTTVCIKKIDEKYIKTIDIVLICSNFKRAAKNNLFLYDVLRNQAFHKYSKVIIGNNSVIFKKIPNTTCYPLQKQKDCLRFMAKSKVLLHPSFFDSNSNTIREAYYHGCLPLITRNVGYYELFPNYLICNDFSITEWSKKLYYLLYNYDEVKNTQIKFNLKLNLDELLL
jgi:glycosyltransferase involved in cell wall biosynthesis